MGLFYFNARLYDPELGRFIQKDPIEDGTNWYVYCANNPLKFTDPDGKKLVPVGTAEEKALYYKALLYLMIGSPKANKMIQKLDESKIVIEIKFNNSGNDYFTPSGKEISWDPHAGLQVASTGLRQTPALGLAHEMGHFAQYLKYGAAFGFFDMDFAENENLEQCENPIAKELGEALRDNYYDYSGFPNTSDPTYIYRFNWDKRESVSREARKKKLAECRSIWAIIYGMTESEYLGS